MAGAETSHGILNAIERLQAKAPAEGRRCTRRGRAVLKSLDKQLSYILRRIHWRPGPLWDADPTQPPQLRMSAPHPSLHSPATTPLMTMVTPVVRTGRLTRWPAAS